MEDTKREDTIKSQFPTITELRAMAEKVKDGRVLEVDQNELAALLDKAATEMGLSIAANMELLKSLLKLQLTSMMTEALQGGRTPRVVGITKEIYLEFCRATLLQEQPADDRAKKMAAVIAVNESMGISKVAGLSDEGDQVVRHIRDVSSLWPSWAQELAEFSEKKGGVL